MSAQEFRDREPELTQARRPNNQIFANNRAFYERLQGQGRKSAIERYGWIAVPVAAVAIIGIAAATSLPRQSAGDDAGPPAQATVAAATPAPADAAPLPALNEAQLSNTPAKASDLSTPADKPAVGVAKAARSPASAPAPVKVARKAPASDTATTRPASAAQAETTPAPAARDATPQPSAPAAPAPSPDSSPAQASPSQSAPTDAQPAQ